MSTYEAQLEQLQAAILLSSAESLFKSAMESSSSSLSDPRSIKDELAYLKEFCSKLKFQYLEQETRDKFLRLLFLEDTQEVLVEKLDQIVKDNVSLKSALKQLKSEMMSVLERSEAMTEEVLALSASYDSRKAEVSEALAGVESLQSELDSLLKDPENENHVTLFNVKRLIDTEDIGLNEAISIAESTVAQESQALSDLKLAVARASAETTAQEKLTSSLSEQLEKLQSLVDAESQKPAQDVDPEQEYAQWLRELNLTVSKFVPVNVEVKKSNEDSILTIGSAKLTLDKQLNVIECSLGTSGTLAEINCAEGPKKFWKLLLFLSEMIFAESS